MKDATLAQGNQVLNLILQKGVPASQLQALIESGLLSDLLDANVENVDRKKFREVIGLEKSEKEVFTHRFLIRNLSVSYEIVESLVETELGDETRPFLWSAQGSSRGRRPGFASCPKQLAFFFITLR